MTPEQIETFFGRITDLRDRALFSLLYRSGLRVGEALSLDVSDVNLEDGTFRVVGKGNAERVGYLSEETKPLLRRYMRSRGTPQAGPLFESREGRLSYPMAYVLFRRYAGGLKRPDGRPVTIHQLRHAFGTERAGRMDALVLRDLMGHRNIRTTLRYARVNPERTRQAFEEFDRRHTRKLPRGRGT
jgi:integrase